MISMGLIRSLVIYYGLPLRVARLAWFYRGFVQPGGLAFDIGAHVGHHSLALKRAGVRVAAVEPQPEFVRFLRRWIEIPGKIDVLDMAVGAAAGETMLYVSARHPTVSTLSEAWTEQVRRSASFARVEWNEQVPVQVTTLDALISAYGVPDFVKIDVEGFELEILRGLSQPVRGLSFEYLPAAIDAALGCLDRLEELGSYEYNWSAAERLKLEPQWVPAGAAAAYLKSLSMEEREGNLYARIQT